MKNELPDDINQLKAMLRKQRTMLNDQQTRIRRQLVLPTGANYFGRIH
ncbi:hypothetical protein JBO38_21830 [Enterobacter asburiae]|nr:hypothetical protein [Enterobacter asburiae]MBL5950364.1 hypothetical protein [Enterobacter asburiae]